MLYFAARVWKKMKLQGTQTVSVALFFFALVWKKIKLHGSQTRKNIPSLAPWAWKTWNYRGLKLDWRRNWFRKRKITGHSNRIFLMCRWISSLEGWLQGAQTRSDQRRSCDLVWKGVKLQGAQTSEIKKPLFCKEAKLHGAQTLHPLKITNVQV